MNRVLTLDRTLTLLDAAVQARGRDFVYRPVWIEEHRYLTCVYALDGAPHCLIGEVLHRAGVSIDVLEHLGDDGLRELYFAGALPLHMRFDAVVVLHRAQLSQDAFVAWGSVLSEANAVAQDLYRPGRVRRRHRAPAGRSPRPTLSLVQ